MKKTDFFNNQPIAIVGVSRNNSKFANKFFNKLIKNGYNVVPVNPHTDEIDGVKCYRNILDAPKDIKSVIIITKNKHTDQILKDTIELGIKNIWIQQESDTKETLNIANQHPDYNIITNSCIFMYAKPVTGMHKFHKFIKSLIHKEED